MTGRICSGGERDGGGGGGEAGEWGERQRGTDRETKKEKRKGEAARSRKEKNSFSLHQMMIFM